MEHSNVHNCAARVKEEPSDEPLSENARKMIDEKPDLKNFQLLSFPPENSQPKTPRKWYVNHKSELNNELEIVAECEDVKPNMNLKAVHKINYDSPNFLRNVKDDNGYKSQNAIKIEPVTKVKQEFFGDVAEESNMNFDCEVIEKNKKNRITKKLNNENNLKTRNGSTNNRTIYACEICKKNFSTKGSLSRHVKSLHHRITHSCDTRGNTFSLRSNLKVHIDAVHNGLKHTGDKCRKSSLQRSKLRTHIDSVFEATECKTIDELERTVIKNVGRILRSEELCYLNEMLTVRFKLSARYIADSDNERHCKRIDIFTRILKLHDSKRCIVLDDAHNMDPMSWEFLKRAMNDKNIVLVMAILVPKRSNDVSQIELAPYNDERLFRHRLEELETRYLPALVCQFMNVHGFSQELYK
ncbi:uncharacterized protein LOC106653320 [Trichogramma pretiosum]|uniref:uncharacterized protein LOC106653320 n=1 Tax=Trichogramma pretiosum TaxID=7493 RepID=UPI000C719927|nr:uncharacterized protein LOC106653320 [Trichogramma pretiosum]